MQKDVKVEKQKQIDTVVYFIVKQCLLYLHLYSAFTN